MVSRLPVIDDDGEVGDLSEVDPALFKPFQKLPASLQAEKPRVWPWWTRRCTWQNDLQGLSGVLSRRLMDESSGKWLIKKEFQEEIMIGIFWNVGFIPQILRDTLSVSPDKRSLPCKNSVRIAIVFLPLLIGHRNFAVPVARTVHIQVGAWLRQMSTSYLPSLVITQQRAAEMR